MAAFAACLAAAVAWIYGPSLHGGRLWDDAPQIFQNPDLRTAAGLATVWFRPAGPDYLPVLTTVQWLQWHAWGDHVEGYHATSILLHLASALLLWRLLARLGVAGAEWAGLLFAVHPLAVESVAWMAELKNTLSLPWLLLSFLAYLDFDTGGRRRDYARALACFTVAFLSKASVALAPLALLLFAHGRHGRIRRRDLWSCAPFLAVSVALGSVAVSFQDRYALSSARGLLPQGGGRLLGILDRLGFYGGRLLWPHPLMPVYPAFTGPRATELAVGTLAVIGGAAAWLGPRRRDPARRGLLGGCGALLLALLPVLGFLPMSYLRVAPVADHLAYLALAAAAALGGAALGALARLAGGRTWSRILGSLLVALLAVASHGYARQFRDAVTFWTYAAEHNPSSWFAQDNLGAARLGRGEAAAAFAPLERARRENPAAAEVAANLADACLRVGRGSDALAWAREAVRLEPDFSSAQYNLGVALLHAGRVEEAAAALQRAARLEPGAPEIRYNLGTALAQLGRGPEAVRELGAAVRLDPRNFAARLNLGTVLAGLGQPAAALPQLEAAVRLRPEEANARALLAEVRAMLGPAAGPAP
jgi:tetratricopeptide (TPR) repeat protein